VIELLVVDCSESKNRLSLPFKTNDALPSLPPSHSVPEFIVMTPLPRKLRSISSVPPVRVKSPLPLPPRTTRPLGPAVILPLLLLSLSTISSLPLLTEIVPEPLSSD